MINNGKIPFESKYALLHTIYKSKVWYALPLIATTNDRILKWTNGFLYRTMKVLFNIKNNAEKTSMFQICFGK